jgi:hypothetical protein
VRPNSSFPSSSSPALLLDGSAGNIARELYEQVMTFPYYGFPCSHIAWGDEQ